MAPSAAATKLRPNFHRQGSAKGNDLNGPAVSTVSHLPIIDPDEQTRLLLNHNTTASSSASASAPHGAVRTWLRSLLELVRRLGATVFGLIIYVLLVFVPIGIVAGAVGANPTVVFILNFLAIIPLASILSSATEELSAQLGPTVGGLLNASFGNAVELIVSIIALKEGQIRIVQASMLGSILSNMLLVLGSCFLAGGLKYREQFFNSTVASTMSSLMAVASASLIIPATLYETLADSESPESKRMILIISRGTALVLLVLYVMYLIFQLKTHSDIFDEERHQEDNEEAESPRLSIWTAGLVLVAVTLLVSVCANYLVRSINSFVESAQVSKVFVGLILIPIVGNAAEHSTAVIVAWKNKMELAISVAMGSCLQIALFVTPLLVILGWIIDQPMTLHFGIFETVVFFLSGFVVALLIQDGKSNYLEGALCLGMYSIIGLSFFILPDNSSVTGS